MSTMTRTLQLLALLHARPLWTCEELADRLEVTTRTIRRDVTRLRSLDYPVVAVPGRGGGYRLGRGSELPPLVLDDREALAVVIGLRLATSGAAEGLEESAVAALAKIERVLPERLRERLLDLATATVMLGSGPLAPTDPDTLIALAQACRRRERVRFLYRARDAEPTFRHVEPLRLVHVSGRWYLVGYDLERSDWRTFRVDRSSSPNPTGVVFDPRDAPDPVELVRAGIRVAPYEVQTLVRLRVAPDEAERLRVASWGVTEPDGEDTLLRLGGNDPAEVARYLCLLPCRFEVIDPSEVREAVHAHARTLLRS